MPSLLKSTFLISAVFWATVWCRGPGLAQTVAPITSSGLHTQVTLSATAPTGTVQYDITGGTRAGTNLFHSFGDFTVPNNNIANFLNNTGLDTQNILARVTGGHVSNIFGMIQTTEFGNANLFLMNPAGIVFGPAASLSVGGSVAFTTADYLRLADGERFHALPNATADGLLSTAPIAAYGFLDTNPGAITVQSSQLTVPKGHGMSFVGGNISIQSETLENGRVHPARLSASNGQINLATATSPGEFSQDLTAGPNINGTSYRSYGSAHFASGSIVDLSHTGTGKLSIRSGQLVLGIQNAVLDTTDRTAPAATTPGQDAMTLTPGSSVISRTSSKDPGPDIQIAADRVHFIGSPPPYISEETLGPRLNILAGTNGSGDAGTITVQTTGDLELTNLVRIESVAGFTSHATSPFSPVLARGNAGNVLLESAHGSIRLTEFVAWATSQTGNSSGKTGSVTALAPEGDIILNGAPLFTSASPQSGGGGQVIVAAQNLRMQKRGFGAILATDNESAFKPEGITVTLSGELTMADSFIVTSAFNPASHAPVGDITLTAKDIVATQGSLINSATFGAGPGGQLKIFTDTLQILSGSQISSGSTFAPPFGRLPQGITPTGPGGGITIEARGPRGSVMIDGVGSGLFSNTEGTGAGGTINLSTRVLTIQNGGTISASTTGTDAHATGGSIIVNATDQVTLTNEGSITASSVVNPKISKSGFANAGNISLNAGLQLELHDRSSIGTTTESVQANGGNISIRAIDRVRLLNNSEISTSVKGTEGSGGNIFIDPNMVIVQGSNVTAQAVEGAGGNITFVTPLFAADSASIVSASSQRGVNGTVNIQSPTSNLSGAVGQLVSKTSPPQALLQNRCAALISSRESTFVLAGRHSLPFEPGDWLSYPASTQHWTEQTPEHASGLIVQNSGKQTPSPKADGKDKSTVLSLRHLTPPGFLVRTFVAPPTGCPS